MDSILMKLLLEALEKGDIKKAGELVGSLPGTTDYERGYKRALAGIIASVDNKEVNSLFLRMISGSQTKKSLEEQRRESKRVSQETFRPAAERGYEKAWYDVLSVFLGKVKVGLEEHVEGELS
ncbi:MAG: hypothetical protein HXS44_11050 [Theionarchaea archaeon]|nr:hypothetical protein [Theionarchaea archaeon]